MAKWLEFNVQKTTYEVEDKRDADIEAASDRVQHEQEKMVETMKVRWELQKEKDQEKIDKSKRATERRRQSIPIKDMEQYKKDQQLAKLLQEEEEAAQQDVSDDNYNKPANQIDLFRNLKKSSAAYNEEEE